MNKIDPEPFSLSQHTVCYSTTTINTKARIYNFIKKKKHCLGLNYYIDNMANCLKKNNGAD